MFSLLIPQYAYATSQDLATLMSKVNKVIINPIIIFIFAIAIVFFIYGMIEFLSEGGSEEARVTGKRHMVWGIIGICIMVSVFGIMNLLINSFGLTTHDNNPVQIPAQQ